MSQFVVTVDSRFVKGEYYGEELKLRNITEPSLSVYKEDGSYELFPLRSVESIEIE